MDLEEYKHVLLGLIFLKSISERALEFNNKLKFNGTVDPEDKNEYFAENIFWVPIEARWNYLQKFAKQPEMGKLIDAAMETIERENSELKGVLPKNYAKQAIDEQCMNRIINFINSIDLWDEENKINELIGEVYDYFLEQFAAVKGKKGGHFTPRSIVKVLFEMIKPYPGLVFDPCCGNGEILVHSKKFVESYNGRLEDISLFGQEAKNEDWRLCKMNLAIRGIDSNIQYGDSLHHDKHQQLRADYILTSPSFNDKNWNPELIENDNRWKYGLAPEYNANFAWLQHVIHHLSPKGVAGVVLTNGSMFSGGVEKKIRKKIIEGDLVDCMVALPPQLFYNTSIPTCLWFLSNDKNNNNFRSRNGEVIFIDARRMGYKNGYRHHELSEEDIKAIASAYHHWRNVGGKYKDVLGFCKSTTINEIRKQDYNLNPSRYVEYPKKREAKKGDKIHDIIHHVLMHHNIGNFDGMVNGVMKIMYPSSKEELKIDFSDYDRIKLEAKIKELYGEYEYLVNRINDLNSKISVAEIYLRRKHMRDRYIKKRKPENLLLYTNYGLEEKTKEMAERNKKLDIYAKSLYIRIQIALYFLSGIIHSKS